MASSDAFRAAPPLDNREAMMRAAIVTGTAEEPAVLARGLIDPEPLPELFLYIPSYPRYLPPHFQVE